MKRIRVVAAIIRKENKILIAKRNYGEFEGLFEFPGGKIELGEIPEEALKREIREEMEVDINVEEFFININYEYPTFILDMDCYLCELLENDIHLNDHSEIKWIDVNEENIEWVPADIQIIDKLREKYGK